MESSRGRRAAMATAVLAFATIAAAAITQKDFILEKWQLHRFRSGDEDARISALRWIGEHGDERSMLSIEEHYITKWCPADLMNLDNKDIRTACLMLRVRQEP